MFLNLGGTLHSPEQLSKKYLYQASTLRDWSRTKAYFLKLPQLFTVLNFSFFICELCHFWLYLSNGFYSVINRMTVDYYIVDNLYKYIIHYVALPIFVSQHSLPITGI